MFAASVEAGSGCLSRTCTLGGKFRSNARLVEIPKPRFSQTVKNEMKRVKESREQRFAGHLGENSCRYVEVLRISWLRGVCGVTAGIAPSLKNPVRQVNLRIRSARQLVLHQAILGPQMFVSSSAITEGLFLLHEGIHTFTPSTRCPKKKHKKPLRDPCPITPMLAVILNARSNCRNDL